MPDLLRTLINWITYLCTLLIFARVILSFVGYFARPPHPRFLVALDNFVVQVTEPFLAPIRRMLPNMGGLDFSPMLALIVLYIIREAVKRI